MLEKAFLMPTAQERVLEAMTAMIVNVHLFGLILLLGSLSRSWWLQMHARMLQRCIIRDFTAEYR